MDSAITIVNDTGTQYGYVDKYPSIWPWQLEPQSWMNETQKNWIVPYSILTMIAIFVTVMVWLGSTIFYHGKQFLCSMNKTNSQQSSASNNSELVFSQLEGVNLYLPLHKAGETKYITVSADKDTLLDHFERINTPSYRRIDESQFALIELLPTDKDIRKKVLGTVKWYEYNVIDSTPSTKVGRISVDLLDACINSSNSSSSPRYNKPSPNDETYVADSDTSLLAESKDDIENNLNLNKSNRITSIEAADVYSENVSQSKKQVGYNSNQTKSDSKSNEEKHTEGKKGTKEKKGCKPSYQLFSSTSSSSKVAPSS